MKILQFKPKAAQSDEAIYRRLALSFRNHPIWPTTPLFVTELFAKSGASWKFYVLLPGGRAN